MKRFDKPSRYKFRKIKCRLAFVGIFTSVKSSLATESQFPRAPTFEYKKNEKEAFLMPPLP